MVFWFFAAAAAAIVLGGGGGSGSSKTSSSSGTNNNNEGNSGSGYWDETIVEQDLGYEDIPIIKPSFVAFKFTGLRPNTPHWIFFDGTQVNDFVNTSYGLTDIAEGANRETFNNPGDQFIDATGFPTSLGGPSTGPFNSNASGEIEGMLYIQSNTTTSFPVGRRVLTAIDISTLNVGNALSYAEVEVAFEGSYELYYEDITKTWVPTSSSSSSSSSSGRDDSRPSSTSTDNDNGGSNKGTTAVIHATTGDYTADDLNAQGDPKSTISSYAPNGVANYGGGGWSPGAYGNAGEYGLTRGYAGSGSTSQQNVGDWGCFVASTQIEMADGTTKAIADLRLGDHTRGGFVQGLHVYGGAPLYEYHGVQVSGTHYVIENGQAIMVKDTEDAIKVPDVKGLYTIDTSEKRIYANGVEFADHNADGVIIEFFNNIFKDNPSVIPENVNFNARLMEQIEMQVANATL